MHYVSVRNYEDVKQLKQISTGVMFAADKLIAQRQA